MRKLLALFTFLIGSTAFAIPTLEASIRLSCLPEKSEKVLLREARILKSKDELDEVAIASYQGEARLKGRIFWSEESGKFVIPHKGGVVQVPMKIIDGLRTQISQALKNKYADAVVYPDLGHVHLILPRAEIETSNKIADPWTRLLARLSSENLKGLFHTAEMIQLKDGEGLNTSFPQDAWKLWRYFSRNLIGTFSPQASVEVVWAGPTAIYNTVRSLPDMSEFEVLYFSANNQGCFEYTGNEGPKYFDITLETIPYQ